LAARLPESESEEEQDDQQQCRAEKVKLPSLWVKRVRPWFTLAESTFNRFGVRDSRTRFDLVLPALPDDILEQLDSVLNDVEEFEDPYLELKRRIQEVCTSSRLEMVNDLIFGAELGGRKPSQLMESMLALLPPGEKDGLLFQGHFLNRLPSDIRDLVAVNFGNVNSRELARLADQIWISRNTKRGESQVAAVAEGSTAGDSEDEGHNPVAAVRGGKPGRPGGQWPRRGQPKKKQPDDRGKGSTQVTVCQRHKKFGTSAWKCDNPSSCFLASSTSQGN